MAHHGLSGILIAGGASTRFGSPKELAVFEGETLGDRAQRLLEETCDETLVVIGPGDDPGTGPVAAIAAGLNVVSGEIAVVIPVDMPRLTVAALRELAAACREAAVAQAGPLPCAIRRSAFSAFDTEERRLRTVLAGLETAEIELDAALLLNVNTPADVEL